MIKCRGVQQSRWMILSQICFLIKEEDKVMETGGEVIEEEEKEQEGRQNLRGTQENPEAQILEMTFM